MSAAPAHATKSPVLALPALCQLPCAELIAQVAAQSTTISTAVMRPYVSSAPTMARSSVEAPTAPKSGLTRGSSCRRGIMLIRCYSTTVTCRWS